MNGLKRGYLLIGVTAAIVLATSPTSAQDNSKLDLRADSIEYDLDSGNSIYKGNVVIKREDMEILGEAVEVSNEDGEVSLIQVTEGPGQVRWLLESGDVFKGRSEKIEYNARAQSLHLSGNAQITYQGQKLTGENIFYNLEKRSLRIQGGKKRARLRVDVDEAEKRRQKRRQ